MKIDELLNKGILPYGEKPQGAKTLIVVGPARSGTSMVAGALAKLGLFMGDNCQPPTFEDTNLASAVEKGKIDDVKVIIEHYNSHSPLWGWKRPSSLNHLERLHNLYRNPLYIFIFKDIFSIANRNKISMKQDNICHSMLNALADYHKVIDFINKKSPNALLISYDKLLRQPNTLIDTLIDYSEIAPTNQAYEEALSFIDDTPVDYLDSSRITKSVGQLDLVTKKKIAGWAKQVHTKEPAIVEVFVNDKLLTTVIANKYRKDLQENNISTTGCSAFHLTLSSDEMLKVNDVVSVKVKGEIKELRSSPVTIK